MNKLKDISNKVFLTSNPYKILLVLLLLFIAGYLRLSHPEACYFNEFAERDWYRTYEILHGEKFHLSGSELSQGGRLPNPYLYWLQLIPMIISSDPYSLFYFIGILNLIALYFCYRFGAKFFGYTAGVISLGLFTAFPLSTMCLRYLWNPTLMFPFIIIPIYCLVSSLQQPKLRYLIITAISIPIAISCHISGVYLIILSILFLLIFKPKFSKRDYAIALIVFFCMFLPFIIGEIINGFDNTKYMVKSQDTIKMAGKEFENRVKSRFVINTSAVHGFLFNVYPRMTDEYPYFGAFSYYTLFVKQAPQYFSPKVMEIINSFISFAPLHLILYIAANIFAFRKLFLIYRKKDEKNRIIKGTLFILLFLPAIVLLAQSLMVFSRSDKMVGSGVHYFFIITPIQFLIIGYFISEILKSLRKVNKGRIIRNFVILITIIWIIYQALIVFLELHWSKRSGYIFQFIDTPVANLGVVKGIADTLVEKEGVWQYTYLKNVQILDYVVNYNWGTESGLDFVVNRHPKIKNNVPRGISNNLKPFGKFIYIVDKNMSHPKYKNYKINKTYDIGPMQIWVSYEGTPVPHQKLHENLNPFIHF